MNNSSKLFKIILISLFSAMAAVLMFLSFPLPVLPSYLKVDFSDIPAIIAALVFTPAAGILVEGLKNILYLLLTGASDPVGVAANFLAGTMFILPVALIYRKYKTFKSVVFGIIVSTITMAIGMGILNYFLILPAYTWFMGFEEMNAQVRWVTVYGALLPFNAIKGVFISLLFIPVFMNLRPWFAKKGYV
ncbi:ECF transporter S component [Bacillaceae bacterium S4-13-58]